MTEILIAILNMSIAASIVAVAVILVRIPLKKAPKIFSYSLWSIVFLRFICPFNFTSPASLMPTKAEVISPTIVTSTTPQINSGISVVDEPVNLFIERTLPIATASINPIQVALTIGAYIWLCGLIVMVFYGIISYIRVKRRVYDATLVQSNIFETDKISTAFVLGFINPKIYLPTAVKGRQIDYILKHEQVHIQRRDYLLKPLAFFILAFHWFNPIVWVSYYFMSKDMEMSCDEAVLRKFDDDIRQDYSTLLINLYTGNPGLLSPLAFGEGSYKNMKVRIKNVLNFKKAPRWATIACSILLVLFTAGFTTNPPQDLTVDIPNEKGQQADKPTDQNLKNQYALYEKYGLTYHSNKDKLYYKDQIVRYFIDKYNNGQGVLNMWAYDFGGTIDLYAVRNNVGLQGELISIEAYSQEDYDLRTKEIEAEKNVIPNYDVLTFRFTKEEAPDSLKLWIRECEDDVFDFNTTEQNGRYYIYVRGETEFSFGVKVDSDEASMQISQIDGVSGEGYALFSVPLYERFSVSYDGTTKNFLQ